MFFRGEQLFAGSALEHVKWTHVIESKTLFGQSTLLPHNGAFNIKHVMSNFHWAGIIFLFSSVAPQSPDFDSYYDLVES
jgi:hypothetical protein